MAQQHLGSFRSFHTIVHLTFSFQGLAPKLFLSPSARKLQLKGLGRTKMGLKKGYFPEAVSILGSFRGSFCLGKQLFQNICCTQKDQGCQHPRPAIVLQKKKGRERLQVNKQRVVRKTKCPSGSFQLGSATVLKVRVASLWARLGGSKSSRNWKRPLEIIHSNPLLKQGTHSILLMSTVSRWV